LVLSLALVHPVAGQTTVRWMAGAIAVSTTVDPIPEGGRLTELRVVQPVVGGHGAFFNGKIWWKATLDFEGITIPAGELTPGAFGEGFVDRRHPHTYAHELMAGTTAQWSGGKWGVGLAAGKGFPSFGSDDPMGRDPVRFPVNHHWAQILERAVVTGQFRYRLVVLEGSLFNGDEPESPGDQPNLRRFGDSWSARLSINPTGDLEFQTSTASVLAPEHPEAEGHHQRMFSIGGRLERSIAGRPWYVMAEWGRTSEADGAFIFHSFLGEGATTMGRHRLYYRFERTDRPEEERLSAFRTPRPPLDDNLLGITRWTIHTIGNRFAIWRPGNAVIEPFVEGSLIQVNKVGEGIFNTRDYYTKDRIWSLRVGMRVGLGMMGHRMGRYGLLVQPMGPRHEEHMHDQ
jgi:hypothetical protein